MRPLAIDLFCGAFGWSRGLVEEGWRCVGFDIDHQPYHGPVPEYCRLVLQDVLTIHGAQFKDAALIVASPPCQAYSYRAMPWKRAKALPPPSNALFEACFRIQAEAIATAGRFIPLVVENVRGAQPYVGRAKWHHGSFYLWGDVPALMPITRKAVKVGGIDFNGYGTPGYKAQAFNGTAEQRWREGVEVASENGRRTDVGNGARFTSRDCGIENTIANAQDGCKQRGSGHAWYRGEVGSLSSKSSARKAASAHIAKIPLPLARWIARAWYPHDEQEVVTHDQTIML